MKPISIALVAVLAAGTSLGARAEGQVYRCGQTYQQSPCDNGQVVDTSDTRTTEQRRDAHEAARTERQQAKELVAERQDREKAIKPQRDILRTGAAPVPAKPAASAPAAAPPGPPKKKTGKGKGKPESEEPQYLPRPANTQSSGVK